MTSIRTTRRAQAIEADFNMLETNSARAVSDLASVVDLLKILIPFFHDNILSGKNDVSDGDREDLRDSLVPLYMQLVSIMANIEEVFSIHDEDLVVWQQRLDAYLVNHPTAIKEAESRYPSAP